MLAGFVFRAPLRDVTSYVAGGFGRRHVYTVYTAMFKLPIPAYTQICIYQD